MSNRAAFLLVPALLSLSFHLLGQESTSQPNDGGESPSGETIRLVNLLSFRGESRLVLDSQIIVRNIVSGDIIPDIKMGAGSHHIQIEPLSGASPIVSQNFTLPAHANVTLVLTGGPTGFSSDKSKPNPPTVFALVPPKKLEVSKTTGSPSQPQKSFCQLLILNSDPRGVLQVNAKAEDQSKTLQIASGKTELLEPWPIAPLDLSAVLEKPPEGAEGPAELNLFTPSKPTAYYCILYAPSATSSVRAFYLQADSGRDLGQERIDER
jgi:hypothetical protein